MDNAREMHDHVMFLSLAGPCVAVACDLNPLPIGRGKGDATPRRVCSGGVMCDVRARGGVNIR